MITTTPKKKLPRKINKPKELSAEVLDVRALLTDIDCMVLVGGETSGKKRLDQYREAFGVEVQWILCKKKTRSVRIVEDVLQEKPQLVVQAKNGIGTLESRRLRSNCNKYEIPHVIVTSFASVNMLAHEIMKQASDQIANRNK